METLEMLSKVYGENIPWRDPRFMNGFDVLKWTENPSKTMNALDDPRGFTLEVDVLRCCELFRVKFSTASPRTF
ncbi:hypothetical protein TNCV_4881461 [Trichonephila clavipes]|nr:hypothetical protein TNCV_4881461 [Trichonephila clavipes]